MAQFENLNPLPGPIKILTHPDNNESLIPIMIDSLCWGTDEDEAVDALRLFDALKSITCIKGDHDRLKNSSHNTTNGLFEETTEGIEIRSKHHIQGPLSPTRSEFWTLILFQLSNERTDNGRNSEVSSRQKTRVDGEQIVENKIFPFHRFLHEKSFSPLC